MTIIRQEPSIAWRDVLDDFGREIFSAFDPVTGAAWERILMETVEGEVIKGNVPEERFEIATLVLHALAVLTLRVREGRYRNEADQLRRSVIDAMSFRLENRMVDAIDFKIAATALGNHDRDALECILMKYIFGCSLSEIAASNGSTIQRVRTRIKKGQHFMLKRLGSARERRNES
jgi:hypothetical protein